MKFFLYSKNYYFYGNYGNRDKFIGMRNNNFFKYLLVFSFLGTVLFSCNSDDDDEKIDLDTVYNYEIRFVGLWSSNDYGSVFPDNASFKNFIGLTHSQKNALYRTGRKASAGLAEYSKSANTPQLETEINNLITDNKSSVMLKAGELEPIGEVKTVIKTNLRHKYLSIVGKIGPSPDWFVGIENFDLSQLTFNSATINVLFEAYDAGVKSGDSFVTVGSEDTDVAISRITSGELSINGIVPILGYVSITRIDQD